MPLESLDILNRSLGLIFIIISVVFGPIIISKYSKSKDKNFVYIGLTCIFVTSR